MVSSIRSAKVATVRITNYRKDGSPFVNVLTLHPVMDSVGEYRYSIGVLSDDAKKGSEGAALEKLRSVLPTTFDAALQPKAFSESATKVDHEAQRKQYRASMAKFTRCRRKSARRTSRASSMRRPSAPFISRSDPTTAFAFGSTAKRS